MPEYEFVNDVEPSPLILAERRMRLMLDMDEGRTNIALSHALYALYAAATGHPLDRGDADQVLRSLVVPLAGRPSSAEWNRREVVSRG